MTLYQVSSEAQDDLFNSPILYKSFKQSLPPLMVSSGWVACLRLVTPLRVASL